jgi:hypothetical protein
MARLKAMLGYTGAILGILILLVAPFVLFDLFTHAVAATGIRVNPVYTGGAAVATIPRNGYSIVVHEPVRSSAWLARPTRFVQIVWTPAAALPAHASDPVDVNGDGVPDLVAMFDVPADTTAPLFVDVVPLGGRVGGLTHVSRGDFSRLIARVNGTIIVRVPLVRG